MSDGGKYEVKINFSHLLINYYQTITKLSYIRILQINLNLLPNKTLFLTIQTKYTANYVIMYHVQRGHDNRGLYPPPPPSSLSYCFLKQSPAGKKSQHLRWYMSHT